HVCPCGVWRREQRIEIRDHLFVELIDRLDWKLPVGKCRTESRPEPKHRPCDLMARRQYIGQFGWRQRSCFYRIDLRSIKTGPGPRHLVGEVYGSVLPNEVFVPAHTAVRSGFPGFAAEAASMDHHHGYMLIAARRDLILDVHLVDGDLILS